MSKSNWNFTGDGVSIGKINASTNTHNTTNSEVTTNTNIDPELINRLFEIYGSKEKTDTEKEEAESIIESIGKVSLKDLAKVVVKGFF